MIGWQAKALLMIGLAAIAFVAGWRVCDWRNDAQRAEADRQAFQLFKAGTERQQRLNQGISKALAIERQGRATERRDFQRRLSNAPTLASCIKIPGADPVVRLSPGFVRLWNESLAIGLPDYYGSWRTDGGTAAADSIDPEEALENAADNAEQCNDARGVILKFQEWARWIQSASSPSGR